MGTHIQVFPHADSPSDNDNARPKRSHARHVLLLMWIVLVATPWSLQLRNLSALVVRHKATENLLPSATATRVSTEADVVARCPVDKMWVSEAWWAIHRTHYYDDSKASVNGSVLCHFIVPQYNSHCMYAIQDQRIKPVKSAPRRCATDSYAVNYYCYHGSIGYYALYFEGEDSYCVQDTTISAVAVAIGSSDINFNTLSNYEGSSGDQSSYFFGCVGTVWLAYRALVLMLSIRTAA